MKLTKEIKLDKQKIGALLKVSEEFMENMSISTSNSYEKVWMENAIMMSFRSYLWGEDLGDILIQYPANWWQAFKERWYPKWILRKYPVRYIKYTANQKVLYPELKLPSIPGTDSRRLWLLSGIKRM